MAPPSAMLLLPASVLALVSQTAADGQPFPTAIKRQSPDSNQKILAKHLAFAPFLHHGFVVGSPDYLGQNDGQSPPINDTARLYPAYAQHIDEHEEDILQRAAQALHLLQKRAACPSGMNSCGGSGSPNKCCQPGTYCTSVPDTDVGHVACCPSGSTCGGGVGKCPSDATSCAAALGGGCCIPGYVCQGVGCVPSASATPTTTAVQTSQPPETVTSMRTTVIGGNPTTVIVTVTQTASPEITTKTTTQIVTPTSTIVNTNTDSATGNPPWRPTGSSEVTSAPESTSLTQTGCPTGFYGCLATHGGGCCRTDRDCHTYSCPPPSSTTIVSDGATIVVPATDMPKPTASATCAGGWFLCGSNAGALAGCCPSGYECGTASCFTAGATETGKVQKQAPNQSLAEKALIISPPALIFAAAACLIYGIVQ
ncbi:hypothetical protein QQS21_005934 [Conoideocrella luteorostrata]|uniref:GPI anchored protein n=1 Tax=Conoideocrella luteorostrata TaxID=1105319 RepID=A0AAJ0FYP6_9HYPO|nr:hypothetical protein QQS21_005934 [Conoideocrella luteorostrata]